MSAYYNEFDPYAAAWLRNLIDAGHIASGVVDTRDVRDVRPADLDGFTQCHFFAGVGVWSYALRLAGWRDDQPVWTASCPCQPFSAAGAGLGIDDERHLWPAIHWLIEQCRPQTLFGEQVASKDGLGWLDIVSADLEAADYAIGAVDTCAAGFGAPHIRQRLYFAAEDLRPTAMGLADTPSSGRHARSGLSQGNTGSGGREPAHGSYPDRMGNTDVGRLPGQRKLGRSSNPAASEIGKVDRDVDDGGTGIMADTHGSDTRTERQQRSGEYGQQQKDGGPDQRLAHTDGKPKRGRPSKEGTAQEGSESQAWIEDRQRDGLQPVRNSDDDRPCPTNGPWGNADWLFCRDGKWRPVEPGTFPLAYGATSRMGRLRAYGNAICAEQATGFISAYMERDMVDLKETPAGDLFEWSS